MTLVTTAAPATDARRGALLAAASMVCVQLGLAASVGLVGPLSPLEVSWLRLAWAGLLFLVLVRPQRVPARTLAACVVLGVLTAGVTMFFLAAAARLPLGTASALEFLGPLGVAVTRGRGPGRFTFPALAGAGVLLLTEPWTGTVDGLGVVFALAAAACWAGYIVFTQRVGDEVTGVRGLAISLPVAGLVATGVLALAEGTSAVGHLTPELLIVGLGLALLLPVVPFTLELLALRRLTTAAFGTLMSLEPAIATAVGLAALGQVPGLLAVLGIGLVVAAGIGAERTGGRPSVAAGEVADLARDDLRPERAHEGHERGEQHEGHDDVRHDHRTAHPPREHRRDRDDRPREQEQHQRGEHDELERAGGSRRPQPVQDRPDAVRDERVHHQEGDGARGAERRGDPGPRDAHPRRLGPHAPARQRPVARSASAGPRSR
ncbi:EamA family transporter [Pseudonocardia sp.]|uniref:EamA family transporter n=1 Tax=Pseudonocardia sp. TaxID=60912 RepID=UPI003D099A50